jgi:uncharacterized protein
MSQALGAAAADAVTAVLDEIGPTAVAVSGGVDSLTLAHLAHRSMGGEAAMFHAVSAAVPGDATLRVRRHAEMAGWTLHEIDAGEMGDERYLANPVDRCFYCKTDLYGHIDSATDLQIVSGTNLDDLADYRPGLTAASDHSVRHPFAEAGVDKAGIRSIAHHLGLDDIAELPGAPCLASRIETGIRVTPRRLGSVERVESLVRSRVAAIDVRCRIRASGVVVELDASHLDAVDETLLADVRGLLVELLVEPGPPPQVSFEPYRRGSAFLHDGSPA